MKNRVWTWGTSFSAGLELQDSSFVYIYSSILHLYLGQIRNPFWHWIPASLFQWLETRVQHQLDTGHLCHVISARKKEKKNLIYHSGIDLKKKRIDKLMGLAHRSVKVVSGCQIEMCSQGERVVSARSSEISSFFGKAQVKIPFNPKHQHLWFKSINLINASDCIKISFLTLLVSFILNTVSPNAKVSFL